MRKTLFDKIWENHVVKYLEDMETAVLYVDRHLIHEVTSPQAFDGLRAKNIPVFSPERTIATADHNVPTKNIHLPIQDPLSAKQLQTLEKNTRDFNIEFYGLGHPYQGIVHVIGPELGITIPGTVIVCGDSHTATHGAFGSIAFGIGTSQVEQVLATQCLLQKKPKSMKIEVNGVLENGVEAKDIILYLISKLGIGGATGHFIEYTGNTIRNLSIEGRMTLCNMSIEMGARGGLCAVDDKTIKYFENTKFIKNRPDKNKLIAFWKTLVSDKNAHFDKTFSFNAEDISPMVSYGTNPGMSMKIDGHIPENENTQALSYMGFENGSTLEGKKIDYVFIGSCTKGRIEDLRTVAQIVKGKKKAEHVSALIVPGSNSVKKQAEDEGLIHILEDAGFEVREPGCSACLAMNDDKIPSGAYCVSTSNRNFEGRQGPGARTILSSPGMAAMAAIHGKILDIRKQ